MTISIRIQFIGTEVDTKSPAPAKAQPYTLAGAGLLVSTSVYRMQIDWKPYSILYIF